MTRHLIRGVVPVGMLIVCSLHASAAGESVSVYTQRGDNARSGVNARERVLDHNSVRTRFGKLWTLYSDAKVLAQPLYVSGLRSTKCPTGCNTIVFCSMKGTIYAYMADQKPATTSDTLVWARYLGPPRAGGDDIDMWATDDPWWGILGTPVIDRGANRLYVVVWNEDRKYRLYAIDLGSGQPVVSPIVVDGTIGGVRFVQNGHQQRKQRAGLLLDRGLLYVSFGGDNPDALAGWLFVYDAKTFKQIAVWSPTPSGKNGGIWMSGHGLAADGSGNVYLQTGNGDFDPARQMFGDSLVSLRRHGGALDVTGYFAPCDQAYLDANDLDLGSAGPLLLPGDLIAAAGKGGRLYVMKRRHLGGYAGALHSGAPTTTRPDCAESSAVLQTVVATSGHIHGAPVHWRGPNGDWIYLWAEGDRLRAYPFATGRLVTAEQSVRTSTWRFPSPSPASCGDTPDNWMPGGFLSVSSDGARAGTGIVWALVPANGDANSYRGVKGMLVAFNAENVSEELWRSQGADPVSDTNDSFGLLARFLPPTIANGKVFVGNAGDREELKRFCRPARPTAYPEHYGVIVYGLR
jgi:hypothetical protein